MGLVYFYILAFQSRVCSRAFLGIAGKTTARASGDLCEVVRVLGWFFFNASFVLRWQIGKAQITVANLFIYYKILLIIYRHTKYTLNICLFGAGTSVEARIAPNGSVAAACIHLVLLAIVATTGSVWASCGTEMKTLQVPVWLNTHLFNCSRSYRSSWEIRKMNLPVGTVVGMQLLVVLRLMGHGNTQTTI